MRKTISLRVVIILLAMAVLLPSVPARAATNLIANSSAESLDAAQKTVGWSSGTWGSIKATFSNRTGSAADGSRSLYVNVTSRSSGDAKWYPAAVAAVPGASCTYSEQYRSSVATEVDLEYRTSSGATKYVWLGSAPAKAAYAPFTKQFVVPSDAATMTVFHVIAKKGWLETDAFSLSCDQTPAPTPTPNPTPVPTPTPTPNPVDPSKFARPLVSIEFDDGWTNAYTNGFPIVESLGFRATDYIITETPGWDGYVTNAQIKDLVSRGHDIGSHTVSHPHLPTLGASKLTTELKSSDAYLETLLARPNNLFVTPYCESSAAVVAEAKKYYTSLRNCDEDVNRKTGFDAWNIRSVIVLRTTTTAQIQAWLDTAKRDNAWLVLVYHEVKPIEDNDWSITPEKLRSQLQAVKNSGLPVLRTADALAEIRSQL